MTALGTGPADYSGPAQTSVFGTAKLSGGFPAIERLAVLRARQKIAGVARTAVSHGDSEV